MGTPSSCHPPHSPQLKPVPLGADWAGTSLAGSSIPSPWSHSHGENITRVTREGRGCLAAPWNQTSPPTSSPSAPTPRGWKWGRWPGGGVHPRTPSRPPPTPDVPFVPAPHRDATDLPGGPTRERVPRGSLLPPPRRPRLLAQSPGCAMVAGAGGRGQQGDPPTSPPAPHGLAGTAAPRQPPMGGGMRRAGGGNGRGAGRL